MRAIAFVGESGGSGKSTIASSLAAAAHEAGYKVCLVDMDPQGSLMNWARARASRDIDVIACGAARLPALLASLEEAGVALAIPDTPGAQGAASTAAIGAAHLSLVPSRPSLFDLRAAARTREALKAIGAEFAFLLNQGPLAGQTARVQDCVEALAEMGELMSPLIPTRIDYQEATRRGRGVTEFNPSGAAAQEMRALSQAIKRRLSRARAVRRARRAA